MKMSKMGEKKHSIDASSDVPPPPMRKLSRSQSITTSAIPSNIILPPEMEHLWRKRRESLEKLQLDKVAPWMHLHDFTDREREELLKRRRQSLEKLQLDKVAPWMHLTDFSESEQANPENSNSN